MLDPDRRSLYTTALTPPPGMVLDAAVATAYSLDPTTLLSIPLHLALLGSGRRQELLDNGILLLEALRRVSDRICVFVQQGRMQLPSGPPNALYGLLESMLIESRAPRGGAFHPKLWLLRFVEPTSGDADGDKDAPQPLLRLVVLSRNLTMDRSWDLCLTLEGRPRRRNRAVNRPLGDLLTALPGMAVGTIADARGELIRRLATEVRRVDWELPEGFDAIAFHVLGLRRGGWMPDDSDRLAVISPFLSAEALNALRATTGSIDVLISRAESLDALEAEALAGIGQVLMLDEAAETEDGEEPQEGDRAGLHAKALILKKGWYTHLLMGSANATTPALVTGRNLELMVELSGLRSKVEGIADLTRPDGLGAYLTSYRPPDEPARPDAARHLAEETLERAREALEQGGLRLGCREAGDAWRLSVAASAAPALEAGVRCRLWPISVRPEQARDGAGLGAGRTVDLGPYPSASVTGLIAFELAMAEPEIALRFVLNLPVDGLPAERDAAILRLLRIMCRTERVGLTRRRDAMLAEPPMIADLHPEDLRQVRLADLIAREGHAPDVIEYWKSSPYLLNFARRYKLRDVLEAVAAAPSERVREGFASDASALLRIADLDRYAPVDPANPRMRTLYADTLDRGLWRVLWMPPSMPYWRPGGAFAEVGDITKALVFSAWNMVPDAIATLCSYEAERRALEGLDDAPSRTDLGHRLRPLLRFARDHRSGRLRGMPTLALMLPAPVLAEMLDPLGMALEPASSFAPDPVPEWVPDVASGSAPMDLAAILRLASERIDGQLAPLLAGVAAQPDGREDERWYWAAPLLLERRVGSRLADWCRDPDNWSVADSGPDEVDGDGGDEDGADTLFSEHLDRLLATAEGRLDPPLGAPPADLAGVLAELALAGPGNCALRALRRIAPELPFDDPSLLSGAAAVAGGFRSLFNGPESIAILRGSGDDGSYWRLALRHGLDGNLQSLLDEQVHVLQESLSLVDAAAEVRIGKVADALVEGLSIRTAQVFVDQVAPSTDGSTLEIVRFPMRCRFALRFGELKDDSDKTLGRAETVRVAFNSPFRPFVLASTSVGQEGLDFHTWCHAVVHWNLPANPVDLEQREGRVHRYKGHAVRKNIACAYGLPALRTDWNRHGDPWQRMFALANRDKEPGTSDLVPYWIFEHPQGATVERRVPLLPYSREAAQLDRLKIGLALYRLVFGQPRQEDLLAFLGQASPQTRATFGDLILSLEPPANGEEE